MQFSYLLFTIILYFQVVKGNDCEKLGINNYEDMGCTAVKEGGKACPVKYECNLEARNGFCLYKNLFIPIGQILPDDLVYDSCLRGCHCVKDPLSERGIFECVLNSLSFPKLEPGCYRSFVPEKFCTAGSKCETDGQAFKRCKVSEELSVKEGQRFTPPNSCLNCVCGNNSNGTFEVPQCIRKKCDTQIDFQSESINNCAPVYTSYEEFDWQSAEGRNHSLPVKTFPGTNHLCCPEAWVCPKNSDDFVTINPKADQKSDLRCRFGTKSLKLGEGLYTTVHLSRNSLVLKVRCECVLPPFLTCMENP